ncbi:unnamed protein product [Merluccius merluccius]
MPAMSGIHNTTVEEQEDCSPSERHLRDSSPLGLGDSRQWAAAPRKRRSPWKLDKISRRELFAPRGAAADQWTKPGPSGGRRRVTMGGQWPVVKAGMPAMRLALWLLAHCFDETGALGARASPQN